MLSGQERRQFAVSDPCGPGCCEAVRACASAGDTTAVVGALSVFSAGLIALGALTVVFRLIFTGVFALLPGACLRVAGRRSQVTTPAPGSSASTPT